MVNITPEWISFNGIDRNDLEIVLSTFSKPIKFGQRGMVQYINGKKRSYSKYLSPPWYVNMEESPHTEKDEMLIMEIKQKIGKYFSKYGIENRIVGNEYVHFFDDIEFRKIIENKKLDPLTLGCKLGDTSLFDFVVKSEKSSKYMKFIITHEMLHVISHREIYFELSYEPVAHYEFRTINEGLKQDFKFKNFNEIVTDYFADKILKNKVSPQSLLCKILMSEMSIRSGMKKSEVEELFEKAFLFGDKKLLSAIRLVYGNESLDTLKNLNSKYDFMQKEILNLLENSLKFR